MDQVGDLESFEEATASGVEGDSFGGEGAGPPFGDGPRCGVENHHVTPAHRPRGSKTGIPDGAGLVMERAEAAGGDSRLGFLDVKVGGISSRIGGILADGKLRTGTGTGRRQPQVGGGSDLSQEQMELDAAFRLVLKVGARSGSAKLKLGFGVVGDSAHFGSHDRAEECVDEAEDGLMAAEVFGEGGDGMMFAGSPLSRVALEDPWIGAAEAVDGLFDIADEETIGVRTGAAEALEDAILSAVDVLVFVDADEIENRLPLLGESGGLLTGGVPEELQGELFEVGKIDDRGGAAGFGERALEFADQFEQSHDVVTAPIPVLVEGVPWFLVKDGREQFVQGPGLVKQLLQGLQPAGGFAFLKAGLVTGFDEARELDYPIGDVGRARG